MPFTWWKDHIISRLIRVRADRGGEETLGTLIKILFLLFIGVHIVVATPGRLFDHMRTKEFDYSKTRCLVLDEADKIFQYGFEEDLKQIISRLPSMY